LVDHHIWTEVLGEHNYRPDIAERIREHSRKMALTGEQVEDDIRRRTQGTISEDVADSERLDND
jgi:hypothetical protein